jgi:hypothetical protein
LERVAQLLAELLPAVEAENAARIKQRLRQLERFGKIAGVSISIIGGLFILAFFLGAGIGAFKNDNPGEGYLLLGTAAGCIVASLFTAYYVFLRKKVPGQGGHQPTLSQTGDTAKVLPEYYFDPISSVTEQTTDLLMVERKDNGRES